jgi:hypothetical protein
MGTYVVAVKTGDSVTTVIAVVALVISLLSLAGTGLIARANIKSASAAETSAKAAENTVKLEVQRRHGELQPHFKLGWGPQPGTGFLRLNVFLRGPVQLEHLDGLTLTVRDDKPGRQEPTDLSRASGITPEQLAEQVWGPYRLVPGTMATARSSPAGSSGLSPQEWCTSR